MRRNLLQVQRFQYASCSFLIEKNIFPDIHFSHCDPSFTPDRTRLGYEDANISVDDGLRWCGTYHSSLLLDSTFHVCGCFSFKYHIYTGHIHVSSLPVIFCRIIA